MDNLYKLFEKIKIIPVVTIENSEDAEPLAEALITGGLPCAEITFRTDAAAEVIRGLSGRKDILIGAGSVLHTEQAKLALDCGAKFVVSPGFNPKVVQYCEQQKLPVTPGVCTPSEFTLALEYGLSILKFFPAEALGGLSTLKAMSAPFPMLKFIPTGGISPENITNYLKCKQVLACGGSWMVKKELLREKKFRQILQLVKEAVDLVSQLKPL
ncbi:MAG: bifunctional 4-hydroxy-2-oxoglutarate aldolase/2-dehydro-3-deoxy-phosphogluconate aldolase [bacterium]|nr:MAG: bifunctional 4-hydroxy-2-oxoglutarate aldolase/2-dehydro-3-deoxy-phosphogluconate aldolase [bacterium]